MAEDPRTRELRGRLSAAGALLGVPIIVAEGAEWRLEDAGLVVGIDWYRERGHSDDEALALALLQLWQSVYSARRDPSLERRRETLRETLAYAEPLLEAVSRLQAMAELLIAMPGVRMPLAAAFARSLPGALQEQPRHLQWIGILLLEYGAGIAVHDCVLDDEVRMERAGLGESRTSDPVRRVLSPDPGRPGLQQFERALTLLLPAYERLLALDLRDRGLSAAGDGPAADADGVDLGLGASGATGGDSIDAADAETPAGERDAPVDTATTGEGERARQGEGRDVAEGADLFEAEHAAFLGAVLPTPIPTDGALLEAVLEMISAKEGSSDRVTVPGAAGIASGEGSAQRTATTAYRARAATLAPEIERMRDLWSRVIAERISTHPGPGRTAEPSGETLMNEALAPALADALAGVPRPDAYRRREIRRRRTRRAGSTDYVLLIDGSASMSGPAARVTADAVLVMLEALAGAERDARHAESRAGIPIDLDIRTALIVFDAEAHVVKPLSAGLDDETRRAVHAATIRPSGVTNDAMALHAAADQLGLAGARDGGARGPSAAGVERRRIVIVLSDGGTNDEVAAAHALRRLRVAGVRVHGVGIGSDEIVRRYAPTSSRIDDPRRITDALHRLVEDELP